MQKTVKKINLIREIKKVPSKPTPAKVYHVIKNITNEYKGVDGDTPTREELLAIITPLIPELPKNIKSLSKKEIISLIDDKIAEIKVNPEVSFEMKETDLGTEIYINGKKHIIPKAIYGPKLRNFVQMGDTPDTYIGQAGKVVKVKADESGLEFDTGGSGGSVTTDASLVGDGDATPLGINLANENTWTAQQFNTSIFRNNSDLDWNSNNVTIAGAGTDGIGAWIGFQWNHTDDKVYLQDEGGALYDLSVDTLYANDIIISSQVSANQFIGSTMTAFGSGGLLFESNSGTDVALFGAGGGSGATFYGGVNIGGNLAVDTNVLFVDTTNNRVGINTSSPTSALHLNSASASAVNTQYTNSSTGSTSSDGTLVGITSAGVFEINQKENQVMNFYTNNTVGMTINTSQQVLITGGTVSAPSLAIGGDADTGMYRWNATSNHLGFAAGGAVGLIVGYSNGSPYVSISSDATRIGNLIKFNIGGTGNGTDAPVIGIKNSSETTTGKNGGIFTQTRMTSRYLATSQNIGQNDNSFGNPGVIQWTAWEYSDNTYNTLATPTEFTGWSYQYYNGSAYKNLLRIHTSGIYINGLNAAAIPAARLHVNSTNVAAGTPGTEDAFVIGRGLNSNVSYQQVATFAIGTYSTNSVSNGYGPDTRLDLKLKASSSDNFTSNVTVMTWLDTGAIGVGETAPMALLDIKASTTTLPHLRLRAGVAPTTPNDGDLWFDGTDIKIRVAGVTKTFTLV